MYWTALREFMSGTLPRSELDDAVLNSLGAANVHLHNELILCLLSNARCRHLPANLFSQVPLSCRGKVVHADIDKPPPPPPPPSRRRKASSHASAGGHHGATSSCHHNNASWSSERPMAGGTSTLGLTNGVQAGSLKRPRPPPLEDASRPGSGRSSAAASAASGDPRWVRAQPQRESWVGVDDGGSRSNGAAVGVNCGAAEEDVRLSLENASGDVSGRVRALSPTPTDFRSDESTALWPLLEDGLSPNGKHDHSYGAEVSRAATSGGAEVDAFELISRVRDSSTDRSAHTSMYNVGNKEYDDNEEEECEDALMQELDRQFGTLSDIWDPWTTAAAADDEQCQEQCIGLKRSATSISGTLERDPRGHKAFKIEGGSITGGGYSDGIAGE